MDAKEADLKYRTNSTSQAIEAPLVSALTGIIPAITEHRADIIAFMRDINNEMSNTEEMSDDELLYGFGFIILQGYTQRVNALMMVFKLNSMTGVPWDKTVQQLADQEAKVKAMNEHATQPLTPPSLQ